MKNPYIDFDHESYSIEDAVVSGADLDRALVKTGMRHGEIVSALVLQVGEMANRSRLETALTGFGGDLIVHSIWPKAVTSARTIGADWYGEATSGLSQADPESDAPLLALPAPEIFDELADRWIEGTEFESSQMRIFFHEAYLQILGLGPTAIPYLLHRLPNEPERWVGALRIITRETVADDATSPGEAVNAWLQWGRSHHFVR